MLWRQCELTGDRLLLDVLRLLLPLLDDAFHAVSNGWWSGLCQVGEREKHSRQAWAGRRLREARGQLLVGGDGVGGGSEDYVLLGDLSDEES